MTFFLVVVFAFVCGIVIGIFRGMRIQYEPPACWSCGEEEFKCAHCGVGQDFYP